MNTKILKEELTLKRDMDLIRKILLAIEEKYEPGMKAISEHKFHVYGYDYTTICEHCHLLYQKGFVNSYMPIRFAGEGTSCHVGNITYEGYDFLEAIRDEKVWNKVKDTISKENLPSDIGTIKAIANKVIDFATSIAIAKLTT